MGRGRWERLAGRGIGEMLEGKEEGRKKLVWGGVGGKG